MKLHRAIAGSCVALLGLAALSPAQAGWQSPFQVTCFHRSPAVSFYAPVADPCPQPVVTTRYVQRCFYQPVTTYQTRTYYEPVTTYRTSYYCEPVTSYRYTCCYDPCTCTYRQVATPVVSYRMRAQTCPVTSWVQRCCSVPVTTYRQCCYWEAQSVCVDPCAPHGYGGAPAAPAPASPGVIENRGRVEPGVQEFRNGGGTGSPLYDQRYPVVPGREGSGSSFRPKSDRAPVARPQAPKAPVVIDRIAFDADFKRPEGHVVHSVARNGTPTEPAAQANLIGQIVHENNQPRANARLTFVNERAQDRKESATADDKGKFRVHLPAGDWSLFLQRHGQTPVLLSKLQVRSSEVQQMTLVSR